jgi:hypothetical protein
MPEGALEAGVRALTLPQLLHAGLLRLTPQRLRSEPRWAPLWQGAADAPEGRMEQQLTHARRRPCAEAQAWVALGNQLDLMHLEILAGQLALRIETDPLWCAWLRLLQGDGSEAGCARPTLGLVARVWTALDVTAGGSEPRLQALLASGPALSSGALRTAREDLPLAERPLALHPSLVAPLIDPGLGLGTQAAFGDAAARRIEPPHWQLPASWEARLAELASAVRLSPYATVVLRGESSGEARQMAALIAERMGRPAFELNGASGRSAMPPGSEPWLMATAALPVLRIDAAPGERVSVPRCRHYRGPLLLAAGPDGEIDAEHGRIEEWRLEIPARQERAELWRRATAATPPAQVLGWRAGIDALHRASSLARASAEARPGRAPEPGDLLRAMHAEVLEKTRRFAGLAQLLDAPVDGDALVVTPAVRGELDLLAARCTERESLHAGLGAVVQSGARPGVKALLIGASGTGKTLAAQCLAHRLGKPLLRVDAASVTSKYIGETEKNLSQLLARAEHVDCVLLFDEADAIFGSRTEVKQANDRHANAQTNYLLTRIESFGGIALLTSNSKERFDAAFMRRLDAVVEFTLPDGDARRRLWRSHLGAGHGLHEADLNHLAAEVELAGGHIRNAVVLAALIARSRGAAAIALPDLGLALDKEYAKLGLRTPDALAMYLQVRSPSV